MCVRACVCDFCHLFIEFSGSKVESLLWSIVPATLHPLAGEDERKLVHTEREGGEGLTGEPDESFQSFSM